MLGCRTVLYIQKIKRVQNISARVIEWNFTGYGAVSLFPIYVLFKKNF